VTPAYSPFALSAQKLNPNFGFPRAEEALLGGVPLHPAESLESRVLRVFPGDISWTIAQSLTKRLLIDDRQGRAVARRRGLAIIGTGGVLLLAKRQGAVGRVTHVLDALTSSGYGLSAELPGAPRLAEERSDVPG
jgi:hypothetical protein